MRNLYSKLRQRKYSTVTIQTDHGSMEFRLRSLTAREWMEITSTVFVDDQMQPEAIARYVAYSLVDEQGNPLYDSEEGVVEVAEWPYAVVRRLFDEVQRLNGFFDNR